MSRPTGVETRTTQARSRRARQSSSSLGRRSTSAVRQAQELGEDSADVTTQPLLLAARAAAIYLGITERHLRAATAAGHVACVRLRGRGSGARDAIRWRRTDLDEWVEAGARPASEGAAGNVAGRRSPAVRASARRAVRRAAPATAGVLSARAAVQEVADSQ